MKIDELEAPYIICEICGQWGGSIRRAEQMIVQAKMAGADAVKVQLWDTYRMPGENRQWWEYLTVSKDIFLRLKELCDRLNIDYFASPFHADRFQWVREAGIGLNKIASPLLVNDFDLCREMISTGMSTLVSLGLWNKDRLPFDEPNVVYMHCLSKYPHNLGEAIQEMPATFSGSILGYSDHSLGIEALKVAVERGARIVEKHFTTEKSLQSATEGAHVCSMDMSELAAFRNFCDARASSRHHRS